jgi:flavin-dependent dehydrogenase
MKILISGAGPAGMVAAYSNSSKHLLFLSFPVGLPIEKGRGPWRQKSNIHSNRYIAGEYLRQLPGNQRRISGQSFSQKIDTKI